MKLLTRQLVTVALVLCTWAATLLGHVSSTEPFEKNGATVPVGGVASWPLFAADVIETDAAPAIVILPGGNRSSWNRIRELKIEAKSRKPIIRLLHGSGKYFLAGSIVTLSTKAALTLAANDTKSNLDTPVYQKPPSASPSR